MHDSKSLPVVNVAADCQLCDGCKYQRLGDEGWCYMFSEQPESLPCTQHDMFASARAAVGDMLRRRPHILVMLAMAMNYPTQTKE
jgi:hypothetical protein